MVLERAAQGHRHGEAGENSRRRPEAAPSRRRSASQPMDNRLYAAFAPFQAAAGQVSSSPIPATRLPFGDAEIGVAFNQSCQGDVPKSCQRAAARGPHGG
jgi:hypothetical protein